MSYSRTILEKNGDISTPVEYYICDITGIELCESDGWYGNDKIHISSLGMNRLIEEWVKRTGKYCGYPYVIEHLKRKFTNPKKYDRYINDEIKRDALIKYHNKCVYCGSKKELEFDHIIPVSKGGGNEFNNIQILCKKCNRKKSNK